MKLATLFVSLLIITAVLTPGSNLPDVDVGGYDKLIHFGMFLCWGVAVHIDFGSGNRFPFLRFLCAGIAFSLLTEVLQILVEGRSFDVYDMLADLAGLAVGLLVGRPMMRKLKRNMGDRR